jgi:hypothetical protein
MEGKREQKRTEITDTLLIIPIKYNTGGIL